MLFAFMAWKRNFSDKAARLVERVIEYRMLGLHAERVADVALSEPEDKGHDAPVHLIDQIGGPVLELLLVLGVDVCSE